MTADLVVNRRAAEARHLIAHESSTVCDLIAQFVVVSPVHPLWRQMSVEVAWFVKK